MMPELSTKENQFQKFRPGKGVPRRGVLLFVCLVVCLFGWLFVCLLFFLVVVLPIE